VAAPRFTLKAFANCSPGLLQTWEHSWLDESQTLKVLGIGDVLIDNFSFDVMNQWLRYPWTTLRERFQRNSYSLNVVNPGLRQLWAALRERLRRNSNCITEKRSCERFQRNSYSSNVVNPGLRQRWAAIRERFQRNWNRVNNFSSFKSASELGILKT
jgi:hypothetical protein